MSRLCVTQVRVDAADPLRVYRLVRDHLRGQRGARAQVAPGASPAACVTDGLAGPAHAHRRRAMTSTTPRRGRHPTGGLFFTDDFANNYVERFWRSRGELVEQLHESNELNERVGIYSDEAGSPGNAAFYMDTLSERYSDVRVTASFIAFGSQPVCVGARTTSNGTDIISGYLLAASPTSGVVELLSVAAGAFTTLGSATLGALGDDFTLALACTGNQLTGRVNGLVVVGPVTNGAHTSGSVGFGRLVGGFEWLCYRCAATSP